MDDGTTQLLAILTTTGTQFVFLFLYLRDRGKLEALQEARIADWKEWYRSMLGQPAANATPPLIDKQSLSEHLQEKIVQLDVE